MDKYLESKLRHIGNFFIFNDYSHEVYGYKTSARVQKKSFVGYISTSCGITTAMVKYFFAEKIPFEMIEDSSIEQDYMKYLDEKNIMTIELCPMDDNDQNHIFTILKCSDSYYLIHSYLNRYSIRVEKYDRQKLILLINEYVAYSKNPTAEKWFNLTGDRLSKPILSKFYAINYEIPLEPVDIKKELLWLENKAIHILTTSLNNIKYLSRRHMCFLSSAIKKNKYRSVISRINCLLRKYKRKN